MTLKASIVAVGDTYESIVVKELTRTQIAQYSGASGDFNSVHVDEVFAREVAGYPGVFAQGMLTMGLTARPLTDLVGDGRLTRFGLRFSQQVWPGDTLSTRITVTAVHEEKGQQWVELAVETRNQEGVVVASGTASAGLDP